MPFIFTTEDSVSKRIINSEILICQMNSIMRQNNDIKHLENTDSMILYNSSTNINTQ